jgi:fructose-1,6-bisphosphatase I
MLLKQHLLKHTDRKLASLIFEISKMCEMIRRELPYRRGSTNMKNVYGEIQLVVDDWANDFIISELKKTGLVKGLASEEEADVVEVNEEGIFNITLDPLDGSSNIESNNLVGTIIGIYKRELPAPGKNLEAALYMLYGPVDTLVYATRKGVYEFMLTTEGFVLTDSDMKIPQKGKLYSVGGLRKDWLPEFEEFVQEVEKSGYKLRYGGSFVGDANQILHYGGIFAYPVLKGKPDGKLRIVSESNSISFIIEQAGGRSSNGEKSILEVEYKSLQQRTPTYVGSKNLIEKLEKKLAKKK